jgi:hypothetical protein
MEAFVLRDFFPATILSPLVSYLDSASARKTYFWLSQKERSSAPRWVVVAAAYAERRTGLAFNMAIFKWYRLSDPEPSGAYEAHRDPEDETTRPLFLATLRGESDFTYWLESGREHTVRCLENTVVILRKPTLMHKVSPPLNFSGERYFLFLGYSAVHAGS